MNTAWNKNGGLVAQALPSVLIIVVLTLFLRVSALAQCTEAQAFHKMMAFNQAQMAYQQEYLASSPAQQRTRGEEFRLFSEKSARISGLLAQKKWDEVCQRYDSLATEMGFDLAAASKVAPTVEELKGDGGRRGSDCTMADASMRLMETYEELEKMRTEGKVTTYDQKRFFEELEPIGARVSTDPGYVCDQIALVRKKLLSVSEGKGKGLSSSIHQPPEGR